MCRGISCASGLRSGAAALPPALADRGSGTTGVPAVRRTGGGSGGGGGSGRRSNGANSTVRRAGTAAAWNMPVDRPYWPWNEAGSCRSDVASCSWLPLLAAAPSAVEVASVCDRKCDKSEGCGGAAGMALLLQLRPPAWAAWWTACKVQPVSRGATLKSLRGMQAIWKLVKGTRRGMTSIGCAVARGVTS